MSPIQTTALAIRLFAIWLAIYWGRHIAFLIMDERGAQLASATIPIIAVSLLLVAVVILLWFFPRTAARVVLPAADSAPVPATPATWFYVGTALIGLWIVTESVPGLIQNLYALWMAQRNQFTRPAGWDEAVLYYVVELGLGIWLIVGAPGVRRAAAWARGDDFRERP